MNRNELEKMIAYLKQNSKKNASILKDLQTHGDWFIRQQSVQRIYDKKNGTKSDFDIQQVLTTRQDKSGMKLHSVMDADSGQIAAIEMAKAGKSFVLEGPPGTGKSQTIANMIAEFFADGKKVLFVSEKEAGMHIVLHKLDMVGLGDYCLQMHSQDTDEKKILGDIYHTLHLPVFPPVLDKADGRERWEEAAHTLDEYQKQVHQVDVRCGRSLWQLYEEYSGMKGIPDVNYYSAHLNIPESAEEDSTATLLEEYADLVPDVSYDYHLCPWYGFIGSDTSAESMHQIVKTLKHFIQRLEEMIRLSSEIPNLLGISISSCADMYQSRAVIDFMAEDDLITAEFFDDKKLHELTDALTLMEKLSEEQKEMEAKLFLSYRAEVIALDGQELLQELQQYGGHLTKNLNKEYRNLISRLRSYRLDGRKPGYTEASGDLQLLADYQRSREKADVTGKVLDGHTGVLYQGISSDWEKIKRELEKFQELRNTGADFGRFLKLEGARFEGLRRICKIWSAGMKEMDRKWPDQGDTLQDLFDPEIVSFQEMNMKKLLSKLKNCLAQTDMLDSWIRMHDVLNQLKSHGDLGFLNAMIDQGISEKQFVPCYRKNCLRGWIDYLRHTLPEVAAFTREGHDRMVKTFRIEERVQFDRNRRQISAFLSSRRPSVEASEAGSRVSGFMLEERSGRPLQEVLALYSDLVTDCKPCFMVSPQSASCFLRPEDVHFDVVIFDEASQITVEEGLPCIGRADQVIVAGDPRQMPPESTGLSLLDFSVMALPQLRLKWHYRSRSEAIIAFSNHYFYNDSMTTFPTPALNGGLEGIHYQNVKGVYDPRRRINEDEADAIVRLTEEQIREHPGRSLGVVCFTTEQENLIRLRLKERVKSEPELGKLLVGNRVEPFFVKNIESVQGDERDTILMSITYGRSVSGQRTSSFGLLSEAHGERRLNVAVTRAKYNLYVVASICSSDIHVTQKTAEGVKLLQHFLEYAEKGIAVLNRDRPVAYESQAPQNMEEEAAQFLMDCGFEVFHNYGYSEVKTDLAIRKPGESSCFCCIEFDGEYYHRIRSTRDRDRIRQEVMERMGWKYIRIWSTEWYLHPEREKARLKSLLRQY